MSLELSLFLLPLSFSHAHTHLELSALLSILSSAAAESPLSGDISASYDKLPRKTAGTGRLCCACRLLMCASSLDFLFRSSFPSDDKSAAGTDAKQEEVEEVIPGQTGC